MGKVRLPLAPDVCAKSFDSDVKSEENWWKLKKLGFTRLQTLLFYPLLRRRDPIILICLKLTKLSKKKPQMQFELSCWMVHFSPMLACIALCLWKSIFLIFDYRLIKIILIFSTYNNFLIFFVARKTKMSKQSRKLNFDPKIIEEKLSQSMSYVSLNEMFLT